MAESELAVLTTQCLSRRIPDKQTLEKEVGAWQSHRKKHHAKADWQFTTENTRVKLKRLYRRSSRPEIVAATACANRSLQPSSALAAFAPVMRSNSSSYGPVIFLLSLHYGSVHVRSTGWNRTAFRADQDAFAVEFFLFSTIIRGIRRVSAARQPLMRPSPSRSG